MSIVKNVKWIVLFMFLSHKIMANFDDVWVGSVNVNYSRLNLNSIGVGYNITHICLGNPAITSRGFSLSADTYFQKSLRSFGFKTTAYMSQSYLIEERLNLGAYKELKTHNVWALISPEIGITILGFVGIFYGYNFYSDQSIRSKYSSSKFTLSLNIPILSLD